MASRTTERFGRCTVPRSFYYVRRPTHPTSLFLSFTTGTSQFQNISAPARDRIIHLQSAATVTKAAVTTSRYKKFGDNTWVKWISFLQSIDLPNDPFLSSFSQQHRSEIITLFAQSLRFGNTTGHPRGTPSTVEGSIRNSLSILDQTFLENHVPDPQLDASNNTAIGLRRLLPGFKACDKNDHRQKVIPVSVIKQVHKLYYNCHNHKS
jgi:hypothetical protein